MRTFRTRRALVAAPVAAAMLLAACSDSTDAADTDTDAAESTEDSTDDTDDMGDMDEVTFVIEPNSSGDPFADAKAAAGHVNGSAAALAAAVDAAAGLDGATDSPAAGLRSDLTFLLQEHIYLAGIAVDTGLRLGLDSDAFGLAAGALDANSVALADAVGSLAGDENRDPFLDLWRQHIGHFVDYAAAKAGGDDAAAQAALDALDAYTGDAGAFFETITGGELPADAVAENLKGHIATLSAAIDAAAAGDTAVYGLLADAADHVNGSAEVLAGGIAAALGLEGDVSSDAAGLRATLTSLLQEHVYLAGTAVATAYHDGLDSESFGAAAGVLDENSVELAAAVGSVAGEDNEAAFLDLWRQHIGHFVDYAAAAAGNDDAGRAAAIEALEAYTGDAGSFFETITAGELPADALAENLRGHISTLAGAIDSLKAALVG